MRSIRLALAFIITMNIMHTNAQNQKPNIILILADDVGYRSLTCNGGDLYSTPNIDSLAKNGMRFTQCHTAPLCCPSRFMLLTGKYNFRNFRMAGVLTHDQKTIANMMQDAGYKTGVFGKWQLDGGDLSAHTFGFDEYSLWNPYTSQIRKAGFKYKNPEIFTHGDYLPDSDILNQYGPDIMSDSILSFIGKNRSNPFFIYYPLISVHNPFGPTPDDTAFASWDPNNRSNTAYFPSMMRYMDKKIGQLINKLKKLGIEKNTLILFMGDNGTPKSVAEYVDDDDSVILGGKKITTEKGTHVPLIAYWPGTIKAGQVNNDLISFVDFLPTLAGIASLPVPTDYGTLDGVSFFPRLTGNAGTPRKWIFNHYEFRPFRHPLVRWAQTKTYKLYDTSATSSERLFYNISTDPNEEHNIPDDSLTPAQATVKQQLLDVINGYVAQGTPLISAPSLSRITISSVFLRDTIQANGGSTVTASGAVWSTSPNPKISSSDYTVTDRSQGGFSTSIKELTPNTTYYVRAYASNFAGTTYSDQIVFKTLGAPVATAATNIDSNKFTAHWNAYEATNYRFDVSTFPTFMKINTPTMQEGFDNGGNAPTGWTISGNIIANNTTFGSQSPALEFAASNAQVITNQLDGPAIELSFWIKGLNMSPESSFLIEGFDGNNWSVIINMTNISQAGVKKTFSATSNPSLLQKFIQFRFTYTKKAGTLAFDDVSIKYKKTIPFFVPGYENLLVQTNSQVVTGLKAGTNYYYRVRAVRAGVTTDNSNVITVITNKALSIIDTTRFSKLSSPAGSSLINMAKNKGFNIQVFPNPSPKEFILTLQTSNNEKPQIAVMDMQGRTVYREAGNSNGKYIFGRAFAPGEYFVNINSGDFKKTIKIIKLK